MRRFNYPARFKQDKKDGGLIITFRDIPEAITQAETIVNCIIEATDCLEEAIVGRIDDGLKIPKSSRQQPNEYIISIFV